MQVIQKSPCIGYWLVSCCFATLVCFGALCYKSGNALAGKAGMPFTEFLQLICNRRLRGTDPGRVSDRRHMLDGSLPHLPHGACSGAKEAVLSKQAISSLKSVPARSGAQMPYLCLDCSM